MLAVAVLNLEESGNNIGIELAATLALDLAYRLIDRPGSLVWAFAGEGIEHIRNCDDPS